MAEKTTMSWKPDTGLPFAAVGSSTSASSSGHGKLGSARSTSQLPDVANIWQREKAHEQAYGLLVPPLDPRKQKKVEKKSLKETAGAQWFDMPATTVTPELKRELQLLKLRGVLDPKRHYKANDSKSVPKFFQVGTVVEGAADFYSGRLTKRERKLTFADELLADSSLKSYTKRKYLQIQEQKEAGGKKFWMKKKEKSAKKKKNRQKRV